MKKTGLLFLLLVLLSISAQTNISKAQNIPSNLFRMAEGFVRIAEPGVFADTLSILGDVNAPGRYIVPRETKVHELLGYARGAVQQRNIVQNIDWSKLRIEITVSKPNPANGRRTSQTFKFRYNEQYPEEFTELSLGNDDIVSVEIKRKPAFVDWLRVVSSIVGTTATAIIIVDRLSQ